MTPVLRWSNGSRLSRHERERKEQTVNKISRTAKPPPSCWPLPFISTFPRDWHFFFAPARSSFHSPPLAFLCWLTPSPHLAIHSGDSPPKQMQTEMRPTGVFPFILLRLHQRIFRLNSKQQVCNYFQSRKRRTFFFLARRWALPMGNYAIRNDAEKTFTRSTSRTRSSLDRKNKIHILSKTSRTHTATTKSWVVTIPLPVARIHSRWPKRQPDTPSEKKKKVLSLSSKVKVDEILSPPDKQQTRNNTQRRLSSPRGHYELVNKSHHQKVVCTPNNKRAGQKKTRRLWENVCVLSVKKKKATI